MELECSVDRYKDLLIPSLGGLHIGMNFLDILSYPMDESGFCELWIECDILGGSTTQQVMAGEGYARSMRTHKLTLQALWQILFPRLNDYLDSVGEGLGTELASIGTPSDTDDIAQMVQKLKIWEILPTRD